MQCTSIRDCTVPTSPFTWLGGQQMAKKRKKAAAKKTRRKK